MSVVSLSESTTDCNSSNQYPNGFGGGYMLSPKYDDFESVEGSELFIQVPVSQDTISTNKREASPSKSPNKLSTKDAPAFNSGLDSFYASHDDGISNESDFDYLADEAIGSPSNRHRSADFRVLVGPNSPYDEVMSELEYESSSTSSDENIYDISSKDEIDTIKYLKENNRGTPIKEKLPLTVATIDFPSNILKMPSPSSSKSNALQDNELKRKSIGINVLNANSSPLSPSKLNANTDVPIGTIITFNNSSNVLTTEPSSNQKSKSSPSNIESNLSNKLHKNSSTAGFNGRSDSANINGIKSSNKRLSMKSSEKVHQTKKPSSAASDLANMANMEIDEMVLIQSNKDVVSGLVKDVVKYGDKYRRLHASLGIIDPKAKISNKFIPSSTPLLVQKCHRQLQYVDSLHIQNAFLFSSLRLSSSQVYILFNLVKEYAFEVINGDDGDELDFADLELLSIQATKNVIDEKTKKHTELLNIPWLQSYLTHLRKEHLSRPIKDANGKKAKLSNGRKRTISKQSKKGVNDRLGKNGNIDNNDNVRETRPSRQSNRSKSSEASGKVSSKKAGSKHGKRDDEVDLDDFEEFMLALSGAEYRLSSDRLGYFLDNIAILSQDMLLDEVNYRVDSWVHDLEETREFEDKIINAIADWETDNKIVFKNMPVPFRKELIASLNYQLIDLKKAELVSEATAISKELFLKYGEYCTDKRKEDPDVSRILSWHTWYQRYLDTRKKDLDLYKETLTRLRQISLKKRGENSKLIVAKRSMSASKDQSNLNPSSEGRTARSSELLRKSLLRSLENKGARSCLSKRELDCFIDTIVAPLEKVPKRRSAKAASTSSSSGNGKMNTSSHAKCTKV